jgi:arsenite methyltransferase
MPRLADLLAAVRARLYSAPGRDRRQEPDEIVRSLDLHDGDRVADIGAGGGYFTFRLARSVGPRGLVYAVDVDEPMLRALDREARREGVTNVRTVEGGATTPGLPERVDLMFLSHSFHHLPDQVDYLRNAAASLSRGGRVAIVEGRGEGLFGRLFGHSTSPALIRSQMEAAGFRQSAEHDFVKGDSFLIFEPVEPAEPEAPFEAGSL